MLNLNKDGRKILIDLGSFSAKVYRYQKKNLFLERSVSFHFGEILKSNNKAIEKILDLLTGFLNEIKKEFKSWQTKLYATGIFRKLSEDEERDFLTLAIFEKTNLYLNIPP